MGPAGALVNRPVPMVMLVAAIPLALAVVASVHGALAMRAERDRNRAWNLAVDNLIRGV